MTHHHNLVNIVIKQAGVVQNIVLWNLKQHNRTWTHPPTSISNKEIFLVSFSEYSLTIQ